MNAIESEYLGLVKSMPCVLCAALGKTQETVTEAHHPRDGVGLSQRAGHFCACALCQDCHTGPLGIHGDRTYLRMVKMTEWDLHDRTNELIIRRLTISDLAPF